ncbi:hypothetical protein [Marinobacter shengliensis]|uniref:hypothetical protein n=1 Tax=Marinobacter shengliensis TaxID=1389223 RepID=UPI001E49DA10|nr:hypothetical protein [Marinobacter shengliensis]MCD1628494.1 hypothetical protein [Marinobacter shengliensis]
MGDRTYVTLTVRRVDKERTLQICKEANYEPNELNQLPGSSPLQNMGFEEVNYGELPFLRDLVKAGIPFDSSWASGDEYGEGCEYSRYDDFGNHNNKKIFESDEAIQVHLLEAHLQDYNALADLIKEKVKALYVLPWDNQEHNAKLFLTKQLINPE